jgi:hypothetical protein
MSWLSDAGAAILRFADAYTIRARLFTAILGAAPALAALLLLISWKSLRLIEAHVSCPGVSGFSLMSSPASRSGLSRSDLVVCWACSAARM